MSGPRSELWECAKCGAKFVNENQWHSCAESTLADWLEPLGPTGRALYDAFEAMVAGCGPYHVAPAKTRIAFMGLVRFAGITRLRDGEMRCSFSLPYRVASDRFCRVSEPAPGWLVHELRVTEPGQLDAEVEGWVRESYRLMGMRERLDTTPGR